MDSIIAAVQGNVCRNLKEINSIGEGKLCNGESKKLVGNPCEEMQEFIEIVRERQWMVVGHFTEVFHGKSSRKVRKKRRVD